MEMPITSGFQMNRFVPNVRFELIPIKELVSNQDYQRTLSITHIRRAVENFDLYQINLCLQRAAHHRDHRRCVRVQRHAGLVHGL